MNVKGIIGVEVFGKDGKLKSRVVSHNTVVDGAKILATYCSGTDYPKYRKVRGIELYNSGGSLVDKNYVDYVCGSGDTGYHDASYTIDSYSTDSDSSSASLTIVAVFNDASSSYTLDKIQLVTAAYNCIGGSTYTYITVFAKKESLGVSVEEGDKVKVTWTISIS